MATETPTHFDCPLCLKSCKVTKAGRVSRHGFRRYDSCDMGKCPTSGCDAGLPAINAATDVLDQYASHLADVISKQPASRAGYVSRAESTLRSVKRDLVKMARAAMRETMIACLDDDSRENIKAVEDAAKRFADAEENQRRR